MGGGVLLLQSTLPRDVEFEHPGGWVIGIDNMLDGKESK